MKAWNIVRDEGLTDHELRSCGLEPAVLREPGCFIGSEYHIPSWCELRDDGFYSFEGRICGALVNGETVHPLHHGVGPWPQRFAGSI